MTWAHGFRPNPAATTKLNKPSHFIVLTVPADVHSVYAETFNRNLIITRPEFQISPRSPSPALQIAPYTEGFLQ
jgi:hypothetical protein